MSSYLLSIPVICALLSSVISLGAKQSARVARIGSFLLLGIGGIVAAYTGFYVLIEHQILTQDIMLGLPWMHWHLRLDMLSALFFIIIGVVSCAASVFGIGYTREFESTAYGFMPLGFFTGLFVAGMLGVLIADDALIFMIGWEIMSLASYFLVTFQHTQAANRSAGFLYLLMAHLGGLAILLAFGILAGMGSGEFNFDFSFNDMRDHSNITPLWANIAVGLSLFGFGMKAGLVPAHAWLPEAHPVAPSHISALMSGVMLKVAIYGFMRVTFDLVSTLSLHWSWGVVLISIGGASALLGILYALMQNDLKRLLAYSSIENVGIIFISLGLCLLFHSQNRPALASLAMIAALYHILNHSIFKSLLFLSAGAVLHNTHERNLEQMGGLIRRVPYTAFFFLIGSLSIAALPPFNGFVSEWLTFQAALQTTGLQSGVLRTLIPFSAALLALTSALSATCFVKLYGTAFLGQPRSKNVRHAHEIDNGMRVAQGFLALLCLLLGIFPTTVISVLEAIPHKLIGVELANVSAEGWLWLTPISPGVASYSAPLVLLSIVTVWGLGYLLLHDPKKSRISPAWDCGFGGGTPRTQYTAAAFAMPIRRIFKPVWKVKEKIEEQKEITLHSKRIDYKLEISDRSWTALYLPIAAAVNYCARTLGYIQTGNIRTYLSYSFFTLLFLLWLIT
ncbi:MAG: hydrogenase 4 subunit B [Thiotrichaceae bacterium]|nr:hydrogenase 4 subunit B [Thiotrichaceae bacterium]